MPGQLPSMTDILKEKGLNWLGNIRRMQPDRHPRHVLYSQLQNDGQEKGTINIEI